ncbi:addiction module protein [Aerosakkonemataceae cyanobacterium BLCC-F154]|uniref:Addiction module protein n=1 Tax=Floridaenema fluviatile BLCC-F154 TaxID=3153640 RepID=A0ABV4YI84_9CYAN
MRLEQLEAEVMALPKDSQALLLARLLAYLGQNDDIDREVANVWIQEAQLRDRAMDEDRITGIPAEQVFQKLRESL